MKHKIIQLVEPQAEPITLDDVKRHLRMDYTYEFPDDTTEDLLLLSLVRVAREMAENKVNRSLMPQTKQLIADQFPPGHGYFRLLYPPVRAATVGYLDNTGVWNTMETDQYIITSDPVPILRLRSGKSWPHTYTEGDESVKITYITGYDAATNVPGSIKHWMLMKVAEMYEQREASVQQGKPQNVTFLDGLLDRYALPEVSGVESKYYGVNYAGWHLAP